MAPPNDQGSEPIDSMGSRTSGARGVSGLNFDNQQINAFTRQIDSLKNKLKELTTSANQAKSAINGIGGSLSGGGDAGQGAPGTVAGSMAKSLATTAVRKFVAGPANQPQVAAGGGGAGGNINIPVNASGGAGGMGGALAQAGATLSRDILQATSERIGRGAAYGLSANRMDTMFMQMYGMTGAGVRNQLRQPLSEHMLLGGGQAINQLLGMQASTGLSALGQASTVEAFRTISGFSYGAGDITKMLGAMASPDVANRMFMMGGTGLYGIGGTQQSGMKVIQDIVKRTGLTNPDVLKGALQPGSNTRQRLTAMGVPQDMQDMVIQYAMQNQQYQRRTGSDGMYDPSQESFRRAMGIEDTYAVQHEKTTGERLKREEDFYGRQADNFADFERNLRTATKVLGAFEDALSGIIGTGISIKGNPFTETIRRIGGALLPGLGGDATINGGDAVIGGDASIGEDGPKLSAANEAALSQIDAKLAVPLRKMLQDNPNLSIAESIRTTKQQEKAFRSRYTPRPEWGGEKSKDTDRIWNGVVWEYRGKEFGAPLAVPGTSFHETGLAVDLKGDVEWVRQNAAKYGLMHGGTTKGAESDEPWHVEPAGARRGGGPTTPNKTSVNKGSVKAAGLSKSKKSKALTSSASASSDYFAINAAQLVVQDIQAGMTKTTGSIIRDIDKPIDLSAGASAVVRGGATGDASIGGGYSTPSVGAMSSGMSVNVPVNIYLQGSQDMTNDIKKMAREISNVIDQEVRLKMMRLS